KYQAAMTDNDVNELMKYYRSFGFHDVKVARELRFSPDGRTVDVTFHVVEGVRYRLTDKPQVAGKLTGVSKESVESHIKPKPGEYYKQSDVDADMEMIKNLLGYQGREARVIATPVFDRDTPGVMRVQYEVLEQPPARVGQIIIVGNDRTRQNVILRQIP